MSDQSSEIERQENEVNIQRAALQEIEGQIENARRVANDIRARIGNHESRVVFNQEKTSEFEGLVERYRADVAGEPTTHVTADIRADRFFRDMSKLVDLLTSLRITEISGLPTVITRRTSSGAARATSRA